MVNECTHGLPSMPDECVECLKRRMQDEIDDLKLRLERVQEAGETLAGKARTLREWTKAKEQDVHSEVQVRRYQAKASAYEDGARSIHEALRHD